MTGVSLRKQLQTILEEKLLPAARGDASLVLLEPPVFSLPHERITISSTPAAPLPKAKPCRSHIALHYWPEHFLNALRVPYLACVFEGEADIGTALTAEQAKKYSASRSKNGVLPFGSQTIAMQAPGFFLVPPGSPVSYGPRPHWERPDPQSAYSRIFWIHLVPSGVFCHTCASSNGRHRTHPFIFVRNAQLPSLSHLLLTEMMQRQERQSELARTLLLSLLLKVSDALNREKTQLLETGEAIESAAALPFGSHIETAENRLNDEESSTQHSIPVRKAIGFIEDNLNKPALNPASIASHSCISPSHLNRLFQQELNSSVMEYVTGLRLGKACTLLIETDLPIAEVADLSGYSNMSHFSQLLSRHKGYSPRAFRNRYQKTQRHSIGALTPR